MPGGLIWWKWCNKFRLKEKMVFILKHCDKAILRFSANEASSNPDYKILWVTDEKSLLPLGFDLSDEGLSLNDVYWVVPEDFNGKFADYNLYDNRFNRILSQIVFTGYGSSVKSALLSSPEFTGLDCFEKQSELIKEYDANLEPCVYDGFIDTAKKVLTQEHKKNLKKLLNFKFKKHPKYNLDAIRLRKIEDQVQRNVMELLG